MCSRGSWGSMLSGSWGGGKVKKSMNMFFIHSPLLPRSLVHSIGPREPLISDRHASCPSRCDHSECCVCVCSGSGEEERARSARCASDSLRLPIIAAAAASVRRCRRLGLLPRGLLASSSSPARRRNQQQQQHRLEARQGAPGRRLPAAPHGKPNAVHPFRGRDAGPPPRPRSLGVRARVEARPRLSLLALWDEGHRGRDGLRVDREGHVERARADGMVPGEEGRKNGEGE